MRSVTVQGGDTDFVAAAAIPEGAVIKVGDMTVTAGDVRIVVTTVDATDKKATIDRIEAYNSRFNTSDTSYQLYDIKLTDANGNAATVSGGSVRLTLQYPSEIAVDYRYYDFTVYHDKASGVVRVTPVTKTAGGLQFTVDSFSNFVMSWEYNGSDKEKQPDTGDAYMMPVLAATLMIFTFSVIIALAVSFRNGGRRKTV